MEITQVSKTYKLCDNAVSVFKISGSHNMGCSWNEEGNICEDKYVYISKIFCFIVIQLFFNLSNSDVIGSTCGNYDYMEDCNAHMDDYVKTCIWTRF
jgi:hypothetical protein